MAKPQWTRTLSQVLGKDTQEITMISEKTGKEYTTDIIPVYGAISTGIVEKTPDGKYRYSVVDNKNNYELSVKVNQKFDVRFGMVLAFNNLRGGSLQNGTGWYAADSVQEVKK
ncbi:hypothetical protein G6R29_06075 [Fructobacillus sp. M2-14]|uniref:Uncharacterized protein n=1 Tax=Fructobacillus broussonetiae TaxID=2713173 RepID=A0ABS5R2J8_9LACO|nr:hypothetical protein [Fructobacillus broussonetiae]MBS9339185.1 hypothetical protein [Fructobacillus broussonetiae]